MHNTMYLLNLLISGYFSDQYGRKKVFMFSILSASIIGMIKSFSWNYVMFLALEMIETFFASGFFIAAYILGMLFYQLNLYQNLLICLVSYICSG